MQEGLNVSLVLNGATLVGVAGLAVRVWLRDRPQRIQQPLEVRGVGGVYNAALCEKRHEDLEAQVTKLFAKVESTREEQAEVRGTLNEIKTQVAGINSKMEKLLER